MWSAIYQVAEAATRAIDYANCSAIWALFAIIAAACAGYGFPLQQFLNKAKIALVYMRMWVCEYVKSVSSYHHRKKSVNFANKLYQKARASYNW